MSPTIAVPLYRALAQNIRRLTSKSDEVRAEAHRVLAHIEKNVLPSGSGFDNGCGIDLLKSTPEKIVIEANFHHMDSNGFYIGWSHHDVIITPSLEWEFNIKVTGRDKRGIKEFIGDEFHEIMIQTNSNN